MLEKEKSELIVSLQIQIEQLKLERDTLQRQLRSDNKEWQRKFHEMEQSLNLKCQNLEAHYEKVVEDLTRKLENGLREAEELRKQQLSELDQLRMS